MPSITVIQSEQNSKNLSKQSPKDYSYALKVASKTRQKAINQICSVKLGSQKDHWIPRARVTLEEKEEIFE